MDEAEYRKEELEIEQKIHEIGQEWVALQAKYENEEHPGILAGFMLLYEIIAAGEGSDSSGISWVASTGLTWTRKLGILRAASIRMEDDYLSPKEDEDG